jgi:hypothetical protein
MIMVVVVVVIVVVVVVVLAAAAVTRFIINLWKLIYPIRFTFTHVSDI